MRMHCPILMAVALALASDQARAETGPTTNGPTPIPRDQLGVVAGKQYQGDGLAVVATPEGARLRCVFQKLEAQATSEGLWLTSTSGTRTGERFVVVASAVGREGADRRSGQARPLPRSGQVEVADQVARFIRPGLTEEYSVSVDGVRQDFVVLERPEGEGALRVELEVIGAKAESRANGARLVLDGSGRRIAYSRLRATDFEGRELTARIVVTSVRDEVTGFSSFAPIGDPAEEPRRPGNRTDGFDSAPTKARLAVVVDDAGAVYPVRIDPTFSDDDWFNMGGLPGANGSVYAVLVDPWGDLYVGGDFTEVGMVSASRIAKWDGGFWQPLGSGMNGRVTALAWRQGVYAAGEFTTAGGTEAKYVAMWGGGSRWLPLGSGMTYRVHALAVSGTGLYAGGDFVGAGGGAARYIAKWDGSTWSPLGSGMGNSVYALAVAGTNLYAGGAFTTAGGSEAKYVAKWNGSAWSPLGSGTGGYVHALAVSDTNLYAGGGFVTAGGNPARYIAKWDGSTWSALGAGMNGYVLALALAGTSLYAGGHFTSAGGVASYLAEWNGSDWSPLCSEINGSVRALAAFGTPSWGTNLYAGGDFTSVNWRPAHFIAANYGSYGWRPVSSTLSSYVRALAVSGPHLYAGGDDWADHIARWNGGYWSYFGRGINGDVHALAVSGTNLYAGGEFTTAGGFEAKYVARTEYLGNWSPLGGGSGMNGYVHALAVSGTNLYAGGDFTRAGWIEAKYIAKWDGRTWSPLGSGMNGSVYALAVSGTSLYAGGFFTSAGDLGARNIAKWDGSRWSPLGLGLGNSVYALAVSGADLYAGGAFTTAGGSAANYVAKWNGSAWSPLGSGMVGDWRASVYALAVSGRDLYAGGFFTSAGDLGANNIAKWNGSMWSSLGSGTDGAVRALAVSGANLYAGGEFTTAGNKVAPFVAQAVIEPGAMDPGLRAYDGRRTIRIACEAAATGGRPPSPLQFTKNGTNFSVVLVEPDAPDASRIRVQTATGVKAWMKLP